MNSSKQISVTNLLLDTDNPRTVNQASQQAAIIALIKDQGDKLIKLAQDILSHGLSPADLFIVIKAKESAKYIVVEGNRRLAAIKLLNSPSLCDGTALFGKFSKLREQGLGNIPKFLNCVEQKNRDTADIWIQRKHDRGLAGAGVESWTSEAKTRFQQRKIGKTSAEHKLVELIRSQKLSASDAKSLAGKVALTTIRRILEDRDVQKQLGFEIQNEEILDLNTNKRMIDALTKIVFDVARKDIKVKDVYDKSGRKKYLGGLDPTLKAPASIVTVQGSAGKKSQTSAGQKSRIQNFGSRKYLVPVGLSLKPKTSKSQRLGKELAEIEVDRFPLLSALGFRAFIEISCYEYQTKHGLSYNSGRPELHNRIKACVDHMKKIDPPCEKLLKGAVKLASNNTKEMYSVDTLHAYVHDPHFSPKYSDLIIQWDNIQEFIVRLWK